MKTKRITCMHSENNKEKKVRKKLVLLATGC